MDDLSVQLERAIESKSRALKGSDKDWKREATAEVERIRNRIRIKGLESKCSRCGNSNDSVKTTLTSIKPVIREQLCNKCYHKQCERDCREMNHGKRMP